MQAGPIINASSSIRPVKWGVLGVSQFAMKKSLYRMAKSKALQITAIASRDIDKAKVAAEKYAIPNAYGSYEALVSDPEIEAVYIPLPALSDKLEYA